MTVKMVAQRLHYHNDHGKEYKAGEEFEVANVGEAERLERRRKAVRVGEATAMPAHVDMPKPAPAPEPEIAQEPAPVVVEPDPVEQQSDEPAIDESADAPAVEETEDMRALRDEYQTAVGKRPFMGWSAEDLKDKIGQYNRRDMRAQD